MPKLMRTIAALLVIATVPLPAVGDETAEPDLDDLLLLPEWRLEYDPDDGMWSRTWRRTTNESVAFVNESLSDFWYIASSPVDWRWKEWGLFTGLVGTATLFVFYADEPIRDEAVESENFRQFSGKIGFLSDGTTLLVFWEEWCPHCKREVPKMQALYSGLKDDGLQVVGLTKITRSSTEEKVTSFIAEKEIAYPVAKETGELSQYFNVSGIPAAAVLKDGKVVWRGHPAQLNEAKLKAWL